MQVSIWLCSGYINLSELSFRSSVCITFFVIATEVMTILAYFTIYVLDIMPVRIIILNVCNLLSVRGHRTV